VDKIRWITYLGKAVVRLGLLLSQYLVSPLYLLTKIILEDVIVADLLIFAHCYRNFNPPTPVPDWQCEVAFGVFLVLFGGFALLLILVPDRVPLADNMPSSNLGRRVFGLVVLLVLVFFTKMFLSRD
jgi:hypothetical protein